MGMQPATLRHVRLGIGVALLAAFTLIAWNVIDGSALVRFDADLADRFHDHAETNVALRSFMEDYTDSVGKWGMIAVAIVGGFALIRYRRYRPALTWWLALMATAALNEIAKELIRRPRPPYHGTTGGWSFPSGHSMWSLMGYGFLAYLLAMGLRRPWQRVAAVALCAAIILLVGFSRMYLGKHYFTDVMGGFALSGAVLAGVIALYERRSALSSGR